jgi:hypothetical protein
MAIFSRDPSRRSTMTPFKAGLVALVLVVVGTYFAYTQANPFADAFELKAAFNTVNNLQADSPVRIAGVEVGLVKEVAPMEDGGDGAMVTMEIEDHGLPIHEDAELRRPLARHPVGAGGRRGLHGPGQPDRHPGPARPGPGGAQV